MKKSDSHKIPKKVVYLFAGGGTGGHLFPAIAIGQQLLQKEPDADIHFVGTRKGMEAQILPELGYPLHFIAVRGFARERIWVNVSVPVRLIWSFIQCAVLLRTLKPAVIIGTGGYVSGPMLFIAHICGYPTLIQEQNSYPGVTTRLLAKIVDQVHLSFAESKNYFKRHDTLFITGNPVRKLEKTEKEIARKKFGLASDKPTLLVFGGSQGALVINRAVLSILDRLMLETEIQIIWGCGRWNYEAVKVATARYPGRVWAVDFIMDMPMAYSAVDVVVSRAGALALAEISLCGLAAILIPFAAAAANHQQANAMALQQIGSAVVISEKELQPDRLAQEIIALFADTTRRKKMQQAARKASFADASEELAQAVISLKNLSGTKSHEQN